VITSRPSGIRQGSRPTSGPTNAWTSIDALFAPKTGRAPTEDEMRLTGGLSSRDRDCHCQTPRSPDNRVTIFPDTLAFGPPPRRNPRGRTYPPVEERPFRAAIDAWLERGGWAAGRDDAASLEVRYVDDDGRRRIINRWRHELVVVRGWTGKQVASQIDSGPRGEQRFYFWTTDEAMVLPMPEPPERPGWKGRRRPAPRKPAPGREGEAGEPESREVDGLGDDRSAADDG
jgi:hypothetical protein